NLYGSKSILKGCARIQRHMRQRSERDRSPLELSARVSTAQGFTAEGRGVSSRRSSTPRLYSAAACCSLIRAPDRSTPKPQPALATHRDARVRVFFVTRSVRRHIHLPFLTNRRGTRERPALDRTVRPLRLPSGFRRS